METILDEGNFNIKEDTFESRSNHKLIFKTLKTGYYGIGFFVLLSGLFWIIAYLSNQFDLDMPPPTPTTETTIHHLLLLTLVFITLGIPSWIIISSMNYFFKLFTPIKNTVLIGSIGIILALFIFLVFQKEIDWFFFYYSD